MTQVFHLDRRAFVVGSAAGGAGFALGMDIDSAGAQTGAATPEINAWVVVKPDDTVIIRVVRSEMGQGTITGLAQLVAEELDCAWEKVTVEFPTPGESRARHRVWGEFVTAGSRGIRMSQDYVRKGGAAAKHMLLQAAARMFVAPLSQCSVEASVVTHKPTGRTITYGELARFATRITPPTEVRLKDPKDWKIAGKPLKRLDTRDKVLGRTVYGSDIVMPGMLNAAIVECPVFGGKFKSFDKAKIEGLKGVKAVLPVGDSAIAVVADTWWRAKKALDAMPIEWDYGDNAKVSSASIAQWLREGLDDKAQAFVGNAHGDAKAAIASAKKVVEAVYAYPYQNHAAMEPLNAVALWTPEKCEVWTGTQNGEAAFSMVVATSGLPPEKCEVYKQMLGGGFGRKTFNDFVRQAVLIAKQMPGTPVKLLWSREEDMRQGKYHPVTQARLVGAFDERDNLTALRVRISGQSIMASFRPDAMPGGADPIVFQGLAKSGDAALGYSVPNVLVDHSMRNPPVPPGFWRGVNVNQNAIYLECFMDELAHAAGQDPLAFRRKLMGGHPKHLRVLDAVAERIGWDRKPPEGVHRGMAHHMAYGSYVAAAAEIMVEGGNIRIKRIVAATDPGYAVNPAQIERQVAGSFVYGLSALFYGEITLKDGRVQQSNFDTYNSMRIAEMPEVEVIVMPSGGFWGGVGEPTICVAAPAVLNAYFTATGKRIRSIPLKNHSIGFA